jgi:hypothetical protein
MFYIYEDMNESTLLRVSSTNKAKEAWDILQTSYQGMNKVEISKLQILTRDFCKSIWHIVSRLRLH